MILLVIAESIILSAGGAESMILTALAESINSQRTALRV
jgi:hypothetical protein